MVAVDAGGSRVDLPDGLSGLLRRASEEPPRHNVTVLRSDEVLTTTEAAKVLGVSRQFLVRLLDDGVIPSETLPRSLLAGCCWSMSWRSKSIASGGAGMAAFREAVAAGLADD